VQLVERVAVHEDLALEDAVRLGLPDEDLDEAAERIAALLGLGEVALLELAQGQRGQLGGRLERSGAR